MLACTAAHLINFPPQKRCGLEASIVSYRSVRIIHTLGTIPLAEVQTTLITRFSNQSYRNIILQTSFRYHRYGP